MLRLQSRKAGFAQAVLLLSLHTQPAVGQQPPPHIAAVVNGASYEVSPISPGTVVVLHGSDLGPEQLAGLHVDADGSVETSLSGTRVLFDGVAAPLIYTSAGQVAAVTPYGLSESAATVHVEYRGSRSDPYVISTAPAGPGAFTLDASGKGQAVVWNEDGVLNSPGAPAEAGSVVAFYITGGGETDPRSVDGRPALGELPVLRFPVKVEIGGAAAEVLYAGAAPTMVAGVSQINARVPADAASGDHVFVSVAMAGASSQAGVTLAVKGTANVLAAPPQVQAAAVSPNRVRVLWQAPEAPSSAVRTRVERSTGSEEPYAEVAALQPGAVEYLDRDLAGSATYHYRVRFEFAGGYSNYSLPASVVTPPGGPSPPANLSAAAGSSGQVTLAWTSPPQASAIRIERKTGTSAFLEIAAPDGGATSYQDRSTSPGTRYLYRVRAENASGLSAYSGEAAVETPPFAVNAGPPRIHAGEGRRLQWNGATWYPVGYYSAVGALVVDQTDYVNYYRVLFDNLAENNINYFRNVFTMGQAYGDSMTVYQRTGPEMAADGRPKFDLTKFNETYFDYWRNVVTYALKKGIVVQLCILDLWHNKAMVVEDGGPMKTWGMRHDFYYGENNVNGVSTTNHTEWMSQTHPVFPYHQALIRKLVDTMGDLPNIVWEIGNETGRTDWEVLMADYLTSYERSRGLPARLVMPRDLPGHQYVAGQCETDVAKVHAGLADEFARNLPLITDNDCVRAGSAADRRRRAWATLTAGAQISLFHFEIRDRAILESQDTADGLRYLGYLRKFLSDLDVDLVGMRPSDGLVSSGWAYARPGQEYIVYLISGGSTTVSGLPSRYTARWFNPRDGSTRPAGSGPAFTAPDTNDWVLHIRE